MSFATLLALAVGLLVAAPVAAHLLRRKRAEERVFPPAKFLSQSPPTARRRSVIEDRFLLVVRVLSIVALALLGATPFISCSHLAIQRKGGASIAMAIVLDDSLSMRAKFAGDQSRFDRAKKAVTELLADSREGDSMAIVLAGNPPRIALALTSDRDAVRSALESATVSDRATDLDGAFDLAEGLLKGAPQIDKRLVLLSDRADGHSTAEPLRTSDDVSLWEPLPDLVAKNEADCAITHAERNDARAIVHIECTPGSSPLHREVSILDGKTVIGSFTIDRADTRSVTIDLDKDAPANLVAALNPGDAIAEDDRAPLGTESQSSAIGVVADLSKNRLVTGGPPPIDQALASLDLATLEKPLSAIPEHADDAKELAGLIIDDPPGLTPEERAQTIAWVSKGGSLLLTLGPGAASAPLGAGFDGLIEGVVRYAPTPIDSVDKNRCTFLGEASASLVDLKLRGRATLDRAELQQTGPGHAINLCAFSDGAPLLLRKELGRGTIYLLTIPLSVDESDFALRPGFLSLVDRYVDEARAQGGTRLVEAGRDFTFGAAKEVTGTIDLLDGKAPAQVVATETDGLLRLNTSLVARYDLSVDGEKETRLTFIPAREIDLRPREVSSGAHDPGLGKNAPRVDASPYVAMVLLGLMAAELLGRALLGQKPDLAQKPDDGIAS